MSDYSADWPLWYEGETSREDWPQVSDELAGDLERWDALWQRYHDHRGGWLDDEARQKYREQAPTLVSHLQAELGSVWHVMVGPLD